MDFEQFLREANTKPDYNTNAGSYYKDLARKQELIKLLAKKIWDYEQILDDTLDDLSLRLESYINENDSLMSERLKNWDERIENLDEEVSHIFIEWLEDGTLEQIINHDVLGNKADKADLDKVNAKLAQIVTVNVKDFGAMGDGITNDTDAFYQASLALSEAGGGKLLIPRATYIVGKQTFTGDLTGNYAYSPHKIIDISNCQSTVIIEGNGAVLKAEDGLRYGAFDPITGEKKDTTLPFTDRNYKADAYAGMLVLENNHSVIIRDLELDGNMDNLILGGNYGDNGWQCLASGLYLIKNKRVIVENVNTHHHGLDGVYVAYQGMNENTKSNPHTFSMVTSEYNGRQGFSYTGGKTLMVSNSKFNYNGMGRFYSSPAAGVDIEAQDAICRDVLFVNCEMGGNKANGFVAESGDSSDISFYKCNFYGTEGNSIWPNKPKIKFYNCLISGMAVSAYKAENEEDRTVFTDCIFSADKSFNGYRPFGDKLAIFSQQNPIFERTIFVTNDPAISLQTTSSIATYRNCEMKQNGSIALATPRGIFEGLNVINMATGSVNLTSSLNSGKLEIIGESSGISKSPTGQSLSTTSHIGTLFLSSQNVTNQITASTTYPRSGMYTRGDVVKNTNPTIENPVGYWLRITTGDSHVLDVDWVAK